MQKPYLLTWNNGYQRFATHEEMKNFCIYHGISYVAYTFREDNYSTEDKQYATGTIPGTGRMRNVQGFYQPRIVSVTVYLESVKADYNEDKDGENLIEVELPYDVLLDWYFKNLDDGCHECMTDEEIFVQWFTSYTADETCDLYDDLKQYITLPKEVA